ncbi:unnamed protein product [Nesidiocoris tenuis]|uniref:Uncharacterized protein n=1 Tax=Nesidiocoris tenuis TaxID=355587 RepID=A0A6H5H7W6_9HEMI|nr:unnamed protein product [Nesidiocoris tenuis]
MIAYETRCSPFMISEGIPDHQNEILPGNYPQVFRLKFIRNLLRMKQISTANVLEIDEGVQADDFRELVPIQFQLNQRRERFEVFDFFD